MRPRISGKTIGVLVSALAGAAAALTVRQYLRREDPSLLYGKDFGDRLMNRGKQELPRHPDPAMDDYGERLMNHGITRDTDPFSGPAPGPEYQH